MDDCEFFSVHFYPTCVLILKSLSTVGHSTVHVNDVVTDWSYALAEFLVSSLFCAFPFPGNPQRSHCKCFLVLIPFLFHYSSTLMIR